jgi:hypothetical protein
MNCATHNDQAAVAFCRTCGKPLCNNCTRDVRGVVYCEACLAARMEGAAPAPVAGFTPVQTVYPSGSSAAAPRQPIGSPNPALAGILGAIPLGIGAVYNPQYAKGLAHLVIFVLLVAGVSHGGEWNWLFGLGIAFFVIYQIIDAVRSAKAIQAGEPAPDPFGLSQAFGTGERLEATKVPVGAAILIGLGVLFLLHSARILEIGVWLFVALILLALGIWLFAKHWGLLDRSNICYCERCRTRRLMGPAILITLGAILLLQSVSRVTFWETWPAILLVIGVVKLMQGNASSAGHVGSLPTGTSTIPPMAPPPGAPGAPQSPQQPPVSGEVNHV